MHHPDLLSLIAKYKFALAIENAADEDYITEKFWRPLTLGVVPVYWGAPNIQDWAPNGKRSFVDIRDFEDPKQLATYLQNLNENDSEYEKFLEHKLKGRIDNEKLIGAMEKRVWGINNDPERINFIENFECGVCNALHKRRKESNIYVADTRHYGCKYPETVLNSMKAHEASKHKRFDLIFIYLCIVSINQIFFVQNIFLLFIPCRISINKIGITRAKRLANDAVVRAHAEGALDAMERSIILFANYEETTKLFQSILSIIKKNSYH